jgi:hypothetical protein
MGSTYRQIEEPLRRFIEQQHVFFVATAPRSDAGHVNLSPKGLDTFRVLEPTLVGYLDYTGSGVETIAHIRENGRMTIMFCALEGKARIVRLYGVGRVLEAADSEFAEMRGRFEPIAPVAPARSIVLLEVRRVAESCGFGVPLYAYQGERDQIESWSRRKGPEELREYQRKKNAASIDGLPGLPSCAGGKGDRISA